MVHLQKQKSLNKKIYYSGVSDNREFRFLVVISTFCNASCVTHHTLRISGITRSNDDFVSKTLVRDMIEAQEIIDTFNSYYG